MGTDGKRLAWDKGKEISFSIEDCSISSSALDSLKEGEICYESTTGESYAGSTTGYKPIRISYDEYPIAKTVTKEQEQIETLIRATTNLIKEVEELKKDKAFQKDRIVTLEEENNILRNSVEEMYIEMVAIRDKTIILESRKADKEPTVIETSALASCC